MQESTHSFWEVLVSEEMVMPTLLFHQQITFGQYGYNYEESFKYENGSKLYMKVQERDELLVRMDERVKTVFNRMEKFETLFTNHLHHHEQWENDIKAQMRWWVGIVITAATGSGAMMMGVI